MRVLLLEHDPLCAFDFIAALEANGHDVIGPAARVSEGVRLLRRRRIDLALIDLHLGLDHGLDLLPHASAAGVSCIAVTGYPLEAKQASDRLVGCLPKPASGEQIAELVNWFEDACAGSTEKPPSTFMFFGAVLPPVTVQTRAFLERRRARPTAMPKRLRRSLS
jgi:DNA-binding NarL/FixJ family response regulator